jgi:hypothetical protein
MTKKQIRILIITFIVIFLIVFIVFLLTNNGEEVNNDMIKEDISKDVNNSNNNTELESEIIKESVIEKEKEDTTSLKIKSVAKNFAERYGTWSTHNKSENFESAKVYTTSRMENIIEDFIINNEKLSNDYEGYYGVTAKALSVKILNLEDTSASLSVSVQQLETSGENLDENISYENLNLELIKYNDDWFVDYAEWE